MKHERTIAEMRHTLGGAVFEQALARADEIVSKAQLNEAIAQITALEVEVAEMKIASRFSTTLKPGESKGGSDAATNMSLLGLTEAEDKRVRLLIDLGRIKGEIVGATQKLYDVVMDIEATRTEG